VTDTDRLHGMIDELRRLRSRCEPKSNQNPCYLRYSNTVSALLWIIDDLQAEELKHPERRMRQARADDSSAQALDRWLRALRHSTAARTAAGDRTGPPRPARYR
jgi:hypothetical protein